MAGVAFPLLGEEDAFTTNSGFMATGYATSAISTSDSTRMIQAIYFHRYRGAYGQCYSRIDAAPQEVNQEVST